jgi:3'DNA-binding domain (3'BD)
VSFVKPGIRGRPMAKRIVDVLVPVALDQAYSYRVPPELELAPGDLVRVPLGPRECTAVVWADNATPPRLDNRLKDIAAKLDIPGVLDGLIDEGTPEAVALPAEPGARPPDPGYAVPEFAPAQAGAGAALRDCVSAGGYSVTLLDGVTGSGKTEVYFEAVAEAISRGRQSLILMPEIALTFETPRCLGLNPNGTQTPNDHHRLRPCQHHGSGPQYPGRGPEAGGLHHDPLRKEIRHQHGEPRGTAHRARFPAKRGRADGYPH